MTLPVGWEGPGRHVLALDEPWCRLEHVGVSILPARRPMSDASDVLGADPGPWAMLEARLR